MTGKGLSWKPDLFSWRRKRGMNEKEAESTRIFFTSNRFTFTGALLQKCTKSTRWTYMSVSILILLAVPNIVVNIIGLSKIKNPTNLTEKRFLLPLLIYKTALIYLLTSILVFKSQDIRSSTAIFSAPGNIFTNNWTTENCRSGPSNHRKRKKNRSFSQT